VAYKRQATPPTSPKSSRRSVTREGTERKKEKPIRAGSRTRDWPRWKNSRPGKLRRYPVAPSHGAASMAAVMNDDEVSGKPLRKDPVRRKVCWGRKDGPGSGAPG